MVVADFLFDVLLFGLLAVAVLLDFFFPNLFHGVATALVLALLTHGAGQDLARGLTRRGVWSQESLATSVALCALGFIFYFWRNNADIILVVLSIGLMMASLMALIALVACVGACWHERSGAPVAGLLLTVFGALALGIGAGVLSFVLTSPLPLALRLGIVAVGAVAWKLRGLVGKSSVPNSASSGVSDTKVAASAVRNPTSSATSGANEAVRKSGWLLPQRGTVLDRIVPLLVVGALAFAVLMQRASFSPASPAQAQDAQSQNAQAQQSAATSP